MEFEDKVLALAKFLEIEPSLIENNYSHYYTINERVVKEGKTPEDFKKLAADFRSLLTDELQESVTDAIVYPKVDKDAVYKAVEEHLNKFGEKAAKYAEKKKNATGLQAVKFEKETLEDVYNRLREDNLYVVNVAYHLILADEDYNKDYSNSLRRAWLGQPIDDTRKDRTINDGEYLVMTDSEADEWEEEGLRSLFSDMTHGVEGIAKDYLDEDRFVEDHSGNRGENINGYDGTEDEVEYEGTTYYIYRHN